MKIESKFWSTLWFSNIELQLFQNKRICAKKIDNNPNSYSVRKVALNHVLVWRIFVILIFDHEGGNGFDFYFQLCTLYCKTEVSKQKKPVY